MDGGGQREERRGEVRKDERDRGGRGAEVGREKSDGKRDEA